MEDNMNCAKLKELDLLFVYHELAEDEMAAVKAHLVSCAECRERVEQLKETLAMARNLDTPEPSEAILDSIHRAAAEAFKQPEVKETRPARFFRFPSLSFPRLASLAAAAVILLALGTRLFLYQGNQGQVAAKYEWDSGIEDEILALQDELDVLEWEIFEAGDIAEIDRQILELDNSLDENLDSYNLY
jgi:anti-sigma factor RsiW